MLMGHNFDRSNKADRLHIERKRKEHEARERLNKAAPALLDACKDMKRALDNCPGTFNYNPVIEDRLAAAIAQAEKEG